MCQAGRISSILSPGKGHSDNRMKKILILDDDVRYRDVALPYLQSCGFEVHEAATVAQGTDKLKKHSFDLLIVDGILPDGFGINVIKSLRASNNNVPIIFISATVTDEETTRILINQLKVSFVRPKPIIPEQLCKDIVELFRQESVARNKNTASFYKTDNGLIDAPSAKYNQQGAAAAQGNFTPKSNINQSSINQQSNITHELAQKLESANAEYAKALPRTIATLREQIEHGMRFSELQSSAELRTQVHNLKGTAGMHGFPEIGLLMEELDLALRAGHSGDELFAFAQRLRKVERDLRAQNPVQ